MSSLTFHRIDSASELEALPKIDGQIIYTTYETPYNKWYIDVDKNNTGTVAREVIQGVDLGVMELTKSEYEAITDKDAHVMYFITDTEEIAYKDKIYNNYSLDAKTLMEQAQTSATNAKVSETNAKTSETNAKTSETNAKTSETNSANSAKLSESWAVGGTSTRDGEDIDNSKYYAEQAKTSETNAKASETAAKEAADKASSITQIGIATTTTAGIVKPDGDTITVDTNGVIKINNATTKSLEYIFYVDDDGDVAYDIVSKN